MARAGGRPTTAGGSWTRPQALAAEGLHAVEFAPKETLAIMNGTSVMTAVGMLAVDRFERILARVEEASALAAEVLLGRSQAFHPLVHAGEAAPRPGGERPPHPARAAGQPAARPAAAQRAARPGPLLDPLRPQALGAARDAITWARQVLQVELNSVNDNPLVDPETGGILFGGNFFGGHPALVMDTLKIAAASIADLVDRQFALLVDDAHNMGLPETLVAYEGCGVKGLQMACSALAAAGRPAVVLRQRSCRARPSARTRTR